MSSIVVRFRSGPQEPPGDRDKGCAYLQESKIISLNKQVFVQALGVLSGGRAGRSGRSACLGFLRLGRIPSRKGQRLVRLRSPICPKLPLEGLLIGSGPQGSGPGRTDYKLATKGTKGKENARIARLFRGLVGTNFRGGQDNRQTQARNSPQNPAARPRGRRQSAIPIAAPGAGPWLAFRRPSLPFMLPFSRAAGGGAARRSIVSRPPLTCASCCAYASFLYGDNPETSDDRPRSATTHIQYSIHVCDMCT